MDTGRANAAPRQRAALLNTRSRDTRQALIRAALSLWGTSDFDAGYEASTAVDIAQAAGVSKGTFYFHFANKEAILLEMSSATIRAMIDRVEAGAAGRVPLDALADEVMALMARRVVRAPKAAALRAGDLGVTAGDNRGIAASPRLDEAFELLLDYGKQRGELPGPADVSEGAAMLTAVTIEAITRWGSGDRSATWLADILRGRAALLLCGMRSFDRT